MPLSLFLHIFTNPFKKTCQSKPVKITKNSSSDKLIKSNSVMRNLYLLHNI